MASLGLHCLRKLKYCFSWCVEGSLSCSLAVFVRSTRCRLCHSADGSGGIVMLLSEAEESENFLRQPCEVRACKVIFNSPERSSERSMGSR